MTKTSQAPAKSISELPEYDVAPLKIGAEDIVLPAEDGRKECYCEKEIMERKAGEWQGVERNEGCRGYGLWDTLRELFVVLNALSNGSVDLIPTNFVHPLNHLALCPFPLLTRLQSSWRWSSLSPPTPCTSPTPHPLSQHSAQVQFIPTSPTPSTTSLHRIDLTRRSPPHLTLPVRIPPVSFDMGVSLPNAIKQYGTYPAVVFSHERIVPGVPTFDFGPTSSSSRAAYNPS
ncbi:hypothetical protein BDN72DRAFT_898458 [Pluteus cervinus]|uniref:Uncharacterized protein n=1 Tax=Pluteus cervinus TaxID=181527 RepID=A0ACD3AQW3_9AGAR|nr:hypothetical protein BDN72DRAFT_898458 [Pluteus cervinus]